MTGFVAIIGSFDGEYDGHLATREAVIHAASAANCVLNTRWVTPDDLSDPQAALEGSVAALIACRNPKKPRRLMPDVLRALTWLRTQGIPTLGIECGFQHMVIEIAREVAGHPEATSAAYDENGPYPVLVGLDDDAGTRSKHAPHSATFDIREGSRLATYYQTKSVNEAYRSEFAVNADFISELEGSGATFSAQGEHETRPFVAAMEWRSQPYFLGVAFLPQFQSRPGQPHPLFSALISQALQR